MSKLRVWGAQDTQGTDMVQITKPPSGLLSPEPDNQCAGLGVVTVIDLLLKSSTDHMTHQ